MRNNKLLLLFTCLCFSVINVLHGQSGIFESYVIIDVNNSGNTYYDLQASTGNPDFNGTDLGTFNCGDSFVLNGAQNKIYKCSSDDVTGGKLRYAVYSTGGSSPSFSEINLSFLSNDGGALCGGTNQTWQTANANVDILANLPSGNYTIEVFTEAPFTYNGGSGTHVSNNGGANYKATFTVIKTTYYPDVDNDGYGDPNAPTIDACSQPLGFVADNSDCDDTNAAVNPLATEICDGIDNNCDGQTDEGLIVTYYADVDNDGFGDPNAPTIDACSQPLGFVADNTDCDDTNAAINPDADEVCDGVDNNCDGVTDTDAIDQNTYYADTDGDGFGDANNTTQACTAPAGFVENDTDCDDNNAAVNPDADEVCDSIDNNCDGVTDTDAINQQTFYADTDGDGFGDAATSVVACIAPANYVTDNTDCDDTNANRNPGLTEVLFNGIDDDCNPNTIDENSGIFESYVVINNTYYDLQADTPNTDFQGADLGNFNCNTALNLNGAQNKIFKCNDGDITNGTLLWRVYESSATPGVFNTFNVNFSANDAGAPFGCQNQTWDTSDAALSLLDGLTSGTYTIEVYTEANYTYTGGSGTHQANNNGANYTATFTYTDAMPTAVCQDVTLLLDANGQATLTAEQLDNGSSDDCGIASMSIDRTDFSCADIGAGGSGSEISDLFISEYIEGGNNNKCIEIYNGTGTAVDLSAGNYTLERYTNGSTTSFSIPLTGIIADGDVFVICNSQAASSFTALADATSGSLTYNGDDALALEKDGVAIDIFGNIGIDPGSSWNQSGNSTVNRTLVRNADVLSGNVDDATGFPSLGTEWTQFPQDDSSNLGSHTVNNSGGGASGIEVTLTVTDTLGQTATCSAMVTVVDTITPEALCQDIEVALDADGNASITAEAIDNGSTDNCSDVNLAIDIDSFDCSNLGANTVTLTVTDAYGNSSSCAATVIVVDTTAPEPDVATLDAINAQCEVTELTAPTATDNCDSNLTVTNDATLPITESTMITWMFTDANNNSVTQTQNVVVEDTIAPEAICQDVTLVLDANGQASLAAAEVDNGSNDNCSAVTLALSQTEFSCADIPTTSGGTISDLFISEYIEGSGNNKCIEIYNGTGAAIDLSAANYNLKLYFNGSSSSSTSIALSGTIADGDVYVVCNSGATSAFTSQANLTSGSLSFNGDDVVVLEKDGVSIDIFGRIGQDPGSAWSQGGNSTANKTLVRNADVLSGNTDNAFDFPALANEWMQFSQDNASNLGSHTVNASGSGVTVTLTVTDASGNASTCEATVTLTETIAPTAICQDIEVALDADGLATITPEQIDNGSTDNCGGVTFALDQTDFDCSNLGANQVTLTVTDNNGNTNSCTATVTVVDDLAPVADVTELAAVEAECEVTELTAPTATDNCDANVTVTSNANLPITAQGTTVVTWTYTDASGNTSTQDQNVVIEDTTAPVANCVSELTLILDDDGMATLTADMLDDGSTDNCSAVSLAISQSEFTCADIVDGSVITSDLFISEYIEGTSNNKCIEIYNGTGAAIDLSASGYTLERYSNGSTSATTIPLTGIVQDGAVHVICNPSAEPAFTNLANETSSDINYNGDDAVALAKNGVLIDVIGAIGQDPGSSWDAGTISTANETLVRNPDVLVGNTDNAFGFPALASEWTATGVNNSMGLGIHIVTAPSGVPVTLTVSDANGNSSSCVSIVTILDTTAPFVVCEDDIQLSASDNACGAVYTYDYLYEDNCGAVTVEQTAGLASGSEFPIGETTNIFVFTDASGNATTCSFTVTVVDNTLPVVVCPENVTLNNAPGQCSAVYDYEVLFEDNCDTNVTLTQTAGLASGSAFPLGETVNTFVVEDNVGNTFSCSFTVKVVDNEAPQTVCPADVVLDADPEDCGLVYNYDITATDNCSAAISIIQVQGLPSGSEFPIGDTLNKFMIKDEAGNTTICEFTVTIVDTDPPVITCPTTITVEATSGNCTAIVDYEVVTSDNCNEYTLNQIAGLPSGSAFPIGNTPNIYEITDSNGNVTVCNFKVVVLDVTAPTIVCPENIVAETTDNCSAVVEYVIESDDSCQDVTLTLVEGLESGSEFPVGETTVTYQVTDTSGNTNTCSFTVTVNDTQLPVIDCSDDIVVDAAQGSTTAIVNYDVTFTDNCPDTTLTLTEGLAPGEAFPIGTTQVSYTATDASGNTVNCSFTVTVNDPVTAEIYCPDNIVATNDPYYCDAIVEFEVPYEGVSIVQTEGLPSGAIFPLGTTTNTFVATDENGNTVSCSFDVTVEDNDEPLLLCRAYTIGWRRSNWRRVNFWAWDNCEALDVTAYIDIGCEQIPVTSGQLIYLQYSDYYCYGNYYYGGAVLGIRANEATLVVTTTDAAGNTSTCERDLRPRRPRWQYYFKDREDDFVAEKVDFKAPFGDDGLIVKAWPNPFKSNINLVLQSTNTTDEAQISVFDINGRLVHKTSTFVNTEINFGHKLQAGVYLVTVEQGDNTETIKVIKD